MGGQEEELHDRVHCSTLTFSERNSTKEDARSSPATEPLPSRQQNRSPAGTFKQPALSQVGHFEGYGKEEEVIVVEEVEVEVEPEPEGEEDEDLEDVYMDDFNPYQFIKQLPPHEHVRIIDKICLPPFISFKKIDTDAALPSNNNSIRNKTSNNNWNFVYQNQTIEDFPSNYILKALDDELNLTNYTLEQKQDSANHVGKMSNLELYDNSCMATMNPTRIQSSTSLPSYKNTLVLDLDETLVHCTIEKVDSADIEFPVNFNGIEYQVYVHKRPYLEEFLTHVANHFEVVVFTASQQVYAEKLLDYLDPDHTLFNHRLYREACLSVQGNYVKDLTVLNRNLARCILVDNSPYAYGYQIDNGVPIVSWFDDKEDDELMKLIPFLDTLKDLQDVRPIIRKTFRTYEKVLKA